MPAGSHPGRRRFRVFRRRATQYARPVRRQFRAGRPGASLRHLPGTRPAQLSDAQHHAVRRRPARDARNPACRPRRRHHGRDRRRHGGHRLCARTRDRGAHLHAIEHFQPRDAPFLQPVRRRGGAGPRAASRSGEGHRRSRGAGRHLRTVRSPRAARDVLPRRPVYGRFGQVFSLAPRIRHLGQPGRMLSGLSPELSGDRSGDGPGTGIRQSVHSFAQGSVHHRVSRPDGGRGRDGFQDRGPCPQQ